MIFVYFYQKNILRQYCLPIEPEPEDRRSVDEDRVQNRSLALPWVVWKIANGEIYLMSRD